MTPRDWNSQITMNPYTMSLDAYIWREGQRAVFIPSALEQDYTMSSTSRKAVTLHMILEDYAEAYEYIIHGAGGWMPNLEVSMSVLQQTQSYLQEAK